MTWKDSKITGDDCSCRGLLELPSEWEVRLSHDLSTV